MKKITIELDEIPSVFTVNFNPKGLKPCPICGLIDNLFIFKGKYSKHVRIVCSKCEISTLSQNSIADALNHWNNLPRKENEE